MNANSERKAFLKWQKQNYPLLRESDTESNMMWLAWQASMFEKIDIVRKIMVDIEESAVHHADKQQKILSKMRSVLKCED